MQNKKWAMRNEYKNIYGYARFFLFILCFFAILTVDMFVGYSSGDDVLHMLMAEKYNLWEFIKNCETSRISKKISLWLVMRADIMVWRVLNAVIFTLFIGVVSKLVFIVKKISDFKTQFYLQFILLVSMCFAHISIVGFTIFWVTGTQDYLWPFTFGILSLIPEVWCTYGRPMNFLTFLGAVFCAVWGGLGQEQISFMLICLAFGNYICERIGGTEKKARVYSTLLLLIRVACFLFLFLAPGNQTRLVTSSYYTDFEQLKFIEHLFLTVQWELSAFSNELKVLFISIWLILGVEYLLKKNWKGFATTIVLIFITIPSFLGITFLNDMGILTLTEMGILVENIVKATNNTVSFDTMTIWNWISFGWWMVSTMIITPYLLKGKKTCCYIYILGLLLPLMQIVSSSMYVSGGRVFWMSAVLFSVVIGVLLAEKTIENKLNVAGGVAVVFAVYEIGMDVVYFVNNIIK